MNLEDVVIVVGLLLVVGIFAYAFYDLYFAPLESGACIGNKCQNLRVGMEYLTGLDLPTIDDYTPENYSLIKDQVERNAVDNQFLLCKWFSKGYGRGREKCESIIVLALVLLILLILLGMTFHSLKNKKRGLT